MGCCASQPILGGQFASHEQLAKETHCALLHQLLPYLTFAKDPVLKEHITSMAGSSGIADFTWCRSARSQH